MPLPPNPYAEPPPAAKPPPVSPSSSSQVGLVRPIIAGVVAAAGGAVLWWASYKLLGSVWLAPLIIGVGVGLAMRLAGRGDHRAVGVAAAGLTVLASLVGYVWTDITLVPWLNNYSPTVGEAVKRFLGDVQALVLIALGAYLAFVIARRRPKGDLP